MLTIVVPFYIFPSNSIKNELFFALACTPTLSIKSEFQEMLYRILRKGLSSGGYSNRTDTICPHIYCNLHFYRTIFQSFHF